MNKNNIIISIIVGALVIGGGCFYGGMKYGQTHRPMMQAGQFNRAGQNGSGLTGGQRTGGPILGQIISKDDKSITVKLANGGSKIVFFATSTAVTKTASSTVTDLSVNKNVMVTGAANTDGSVTARSIQVQN